MNVPVAWISWLMALLLIVIISIPKRVSNPGVFHTVALIIT